MCRRFIIKLSKMQNDCRHEVEEMDVYTVITKE